MNRADAYKKMCELAIEIVKTGYPDREKQRLIEDIAYDYDIFFAEDDEYLAVEDDVFYYNEME